MLPRSPIPHPAPELDPCEARAIKNKVSFGSPNYADCRQPFFYLETAQRGATKNNQFDRGPNVYSKSRRRVYRLRSGIPRDNNLEGVSDRPTRISAETIKRPSDRSSDRAIERPIDRSTERSTDRATDRTTERSSDRATERPIERSTERSTERATERTSDGLVEYREANRI